MTHAYVDYVRVWHYDPKLIATPWPSSSSEFSSSSSKEMSSSEIISSLSEEMSSSQIMSSVNFSSAALSSSEIASSAIDRSSETELSSCQSELSSSSSKGESSSSDPHVIVALGRENIRNHMNVQVVYGNASLEVPAQSSRYKLYTLQGVLLGEWGLEENQRYLSIEQKEQRLLFIEFE